MIEAELDEDGIAWAECSSPMGGGGYSPETTSSLRSGRCKHGVALLLTWVESPDKFEAKDPLKVTLRKQPQDRLVEMILTMADRHPDLERLVRLSSTSVSETFDPEELRHQIRSVFQDAGGGHHDYYYDHSQSGAFSDVLEALYDDELHRFPAARDEFEKADLL